jgi:hypothetical protein
MKFRWILLFHLSRLLVLNKYILSAFIWLLFQISELDTLGLTCASLDGEINAAESCK